MALRGHQARRGLSSQQRAILDVLSGYPRLPELDEEGRAFYGHLARASDILDALGEERTAVRYSSISRALARLADRTFVNIYRSTRANTRGGFRYALRDVNSGGASPDEPGRIQYRRPVSAALQDARETGSVEMRCRHHLQRHGMRLRHRKGVWHAVCPIEKDSVYHTGDLEILYAWALVRFP